MALSRPELTPEIERNSFIARSYAVLMAVFSLALCFFNAVKNDMGVFDPGSPDDIGNIRLEQRDIGFSFIQMLSNTFQFSGGSL